MTVFVGILLRLRGQSATWKTQQSLLTRVAVGSLNSTCLLKIHWTAFDKTCTHFILCDKRDENLPSLRIEFGAKMRNISEFNNCFTRF